MSEYNKEKIFISVFTNRFLNLSDMPLKDTPLEILASLEKMDKKIAAKGLRESVIDAVTMSMTFSPSVINDFEEELRIAGAPALREMRRKYLGIYSKILKRKIIKNSNEYYLIKNILDDPSVPVKEQNVLIGLVEEYENSTTSRGKYKAHKEDGGN